MSGTTTPTDTATKALQTWVGRLEVVLLNKETIELPRSGGSLPPHLVQRVRNLVWLLRRSTHSVLA